ncbi:MAG: transcription-repair coupling factor [Alphaproteobacteria bacterium]|nr:transcription-repair coupling factor [Alphaproteobacteria bacterium]
MRFIAESLPFFADAEVLTFPAWDCLPYDRVSPNPAIVAERIETLSRLAEKPRSARVLVTTVNALLQRLPPREVIGTASFAIRAGEELDREGLQTFLVKSGYTRVGKVMEPGEFAIRGSIIDLFPPGLTDACRIDLFGDQVESIRAFDPLTQVSQTDIEGGLRLLPASEIVFSENAIAEFRERYRERFGAAIHDDPLYAAVTEGSKYPGMEHWLPMFYPKMETLFDYVPGALVSFSAQAELTKDERLDTIQDYYQARKDHEHARRLDAAPYHPLPPEMLYLTEDRLDMHLEKRRAVWFNAFAEEGPTLGCRQAYDFSAERNRPDRPMIDVLKDYARARQEQGKRVAIACYSEGSRDRLQYRLSEHGVHPVNCEDWREVLKLSGKAIGLAVLPLEHGFECGEVVLLSEQDVLGERIQRKKKKRKAAELFMAEASSFAEGELLVHKEHGIGRFDGLKTVEVNGKRHDCLKLVYDGDDKLFLPVENIDVLSRYGAGDEGVKLDKLGGISWQSRKAKLKERITLAAHALLKIAAERALKTGAVLQTPEGLYDEFIARFPHAETEDQQKAIDDCIEDLAAGKAMDRLVCGDVGFGKTEVALRAAFVACQGGAGNERRQVAIVAPTTLLARQHFHTFKKRFAGMPVTVRQLSRMVTAKEAAETRAMLAEGKVDIVIGTHAILAKNIQFANLGLVIVDEEQHFGVAQKERLKELKSNVHVLTLSATPIPRTLQMALTGVRDLSLIATPPVDRLAVRTFVMPYDPVVLREAIMREKHRAGKVYYVAPRISDLDELTVQLRDLVPEATFAIAHGQMTATQLDDIMNKFYDGAFDILLSTAIVESGLDVPTANTMIIHRADMFGLSQLYQLRGRVGRGKTRAYAYLTLPHRKQLSKAAEKRLEVMQSLDTLGAGFTVASHDMDIRGYGNLLGDEQSGHIKEVGVELYQQMLEEAIQAAKAGAGKETVSDEWSPQINVGTSVLIPESYVEDLSLRLGLYRRAASLANPEEIDSFAAELVDRFGPMPEEVLHLLDIVRIKQLCREAGVERVDAGPKGVVISFRNNIFARPEKLIEFIAKNPSQAKIRPDQKLVLIRDWEKTETRVKGVSKSLQQIAEMAA